MSTTDELPAPGSDEAIKRGCRCHRSNRIIGTDADERTRSRFWAKVAKGSADDCWLWTGAVFRTGYGAFRFLGQATKAHRLSYAIANGEMPAGMDLLHRCDNPLCVNPAHLFPGTPADNAEDMMSKGRHNPVKGERAGAAKLSQQDVDEIRRIYRCGEANQLELGERFQLHPGQVSRIINGRKWRDSFVASGGTPTPLRACVRTGRRRKVGESNLLIRCACGCGTTLEKFDRCGRPRTYVSGHNGRKAKVAASG